MFASLRTKKIGVGVKTDSVEMQKVTAPFIELMARWLSRFCTASSDRGLCAGIATRMGGTRSAGSGERNELEPGQA